VDIWDCQLHSIEPLVGSPRGKEAYAMLLSSGHIHLRVEIP
jgi:hypothetical protein